MDRGPELPADAGRPLRAIEAGTAFVASFAGLDLGLRAALELHALSALQFTNESAVRRLEAWSRDGAGRYLSYGDDPELDDVLPGVKVHVLGPPVPSEWSRIMSQRTTTLTSSGSPSTPCGRRCRTRSPWPPRPGR